MLSDKNGYTEDIQVGGPERDISRVATVVAVAAIEIESIIVDDKSSGSWQRG